MISEPRMEKRWQILLTTSFPSISSVTPYHTIQILLLLPKEALRLLLECLFALFFKIQSHHSFTFFKSHFQCHLLNDIFCRLYLLPGHFSPSLPSLMSTFLNCQFISSISNLGFLMPYTVFFVVVVVWFVLSSYLHKLLPQCRYHENMLLRSRPVENIYDW